jgi:hypothetical protein
VLVKVRRSDDGRHAVAPGLPPPPCGLATGFTERSGTSWLFCDDAGRITTFRLGSGGRRWAAYGKPSDAVVPDDVDDFSFALPPVG